MSYAHHSAPPGLAHLNPLNDETAGGTTEKKPTMNTIKCKAAVFAKAIKLIKSNTTSAKPKLREPNPFDGSNPKKLQIFILQCKLNFRD